MRLFEGCQQKCASCGFPRFVQTSEKSKPLINPHQRCGYSDSPFARKDTFLYCRVQKWVGGGWHPGHGDTKRKLHLRKRHFFVIDKYVEDVKQDEKHVPDLLISIMRPTDPVKEEIRQKTKNVSI